MTDLIKRDAALAAIDTALNNATGDLFDCHAAIRALPAIDLASLTPTPVDDSQPADPVVNDHTADVGKMVDPAAIREAALQARIEELVKERDDLGRKLATCEKYRDAYAECDRIGTQAVRDLEAKLTKAVEALRKMADGSSDNSEAAAKRVLAELENEQ